MRLRPLLLAFGLSLCVAATALASPTPAETADTAAARIKRTLAPGTCTASVRALFHSFYASNDPAACVYLRNALGRVASATARAYGTGAVVDALQPGSTTALVLDRDRRYHIAFALPSGTRTIGTASSREFDLFASGAVDALRAGSCPKFALLAYRTAGLGAGPDAAVCARMKTHPFARALKGERKIPLTKLGGTSVFAFYGITVDGRYYTIVMARQVPTGSTPSGAAPYAFLDAFAA